MEVGYGKWQLPANHQVYELVVFRNTTKGTQ